MGVGQLIETDADVESAMQELSRTCPRLKKAYALTGPLPLRRRPDGFAALFSAIVGQQVSVASAEAVWHKIKAAGLDTASACLEASDDDFRAVGLSRQKIRYARELARADIDFINLRHESDDIVIQTLVAVPGIGPWTAEIYAMFSLGRADVFAPGDLAMQEAARILYDLPERPKEPAFRKMAEKWAPWRAVAARLLWAYYAYEKDRDGIR